MLYVVHVLSKASLRNPTSLPYKLLYLDANLQKRERLTKKVSSSFLTVGRTLIFFLFSFFNSCHSEATCRPLRSTLPGKIFCKPFLKRKKPLINQQTPPPPSLQCCCTSLAKPVDLFPGKTIISRDFSKPWMKKLLEFRNVGLIRTEVRNKTTLWVIQSRLLLFCQPRKDCKVLRDLQSLDILSDVELCLLFLNVFYCNNCDNLAWQLFFCLGKVVTISQQYFIYTHEVKVTCWKGKYMKN